MVLVSPSVKICDFPSSFFLLFFSLLACWHHVGAVSEKQKKKKETLLEHWSPANHTGSGV